MCIFSGGIIIVVQTTIVVGIPSFVQQIKATYGVIGKHFAHPFLFRGPNDYVLPAGLKEENAAAEEEEEGSPPPPLQERGV
jgi:hypothetical protein